MTMHADNKSNELQNIFCSQLIEARSLEKGSAMDVN